MANLIFSKGSGVANSIFGKSQESIRAVIEEDAQAFEKRSMVPHLFSMDTSRNFAERYTSLTSLGDFEDVGENGAYPKTGLREGYSKVIEPATWKASFEVTQEMAEDAKTGSIRSSAHRFAGSFNRTREKHAAGLIAGGIDSSVTIGRHVYDTTSADGKPLFSTGHTSVTGNYGEQSNLFCGAFSAKMLDAVQERMQDFRDDDGNILGVAPTTIIIPNDGLLKRAVLAVVGSEKDPDSSSNALNFQEGLWNVVIWPFLPKTLGGKSYFIVLDERFKENYQCMPWVDRTPLTVRSEIDPNTDANVFRGRARFGAGFNNWRCISVCGEGLTNGTTIAA